MSGVAARLERLIKIIEAWEKGHRDAAAQEAAGHRPLGGDGHP